jgi:TPP-dependent 2-oxoacid decarboxylase
MKKILIYSLVMLISFTFVVSITVPVFAYNSEDYPEEYEIISSDDLTQREIFNTLNRFFKPSNIIISLIAGALIGFIGVSVMKSKLISVHKQFGASNYAVRGSLEVDYSEDIIVDNSITKTPKNTEVKNN